MYYYHYHQNNTGGTWLVNDKVSKHVIIEANNADHANMLAEHIGMDFHDFCECCGERWTKVQDYDAQDTPDMVYCRNTHYGVEPGQPLVYLYHLNRSRDVFYR